MTNKPTVNDRYMALQQKPQLDKNGFKEKIGAPLHLTPSTWLVYTWLLQHSKYNASENEDHYYIYTNSFKNIDIAADLNITVDTVSRCRSELKNKQIMYKTKYQDKAVLIFPIYDGLYQMIYMPIKTLKFFLSWDKTVFPFRDTIIRTFGTLRLLKRGEAEYYTISALASILGKDASDINTRMEILVCCGMLKELGLLKTEQIQYDNKMGKLSIRYNLLYVGDIVDEKILDIEDTDGVREYVVDCYNRAIGSVKKEIC